MILIHCVKSVHIRRFSGPYFSAFGLNTDHRNSEYGHFSVSGPQAENIYHPIFKAILKYKNHPSIIAIKNTRSRSSFHFCEISDNDIYKKIKRLIARKAAQSTDIPVKTLRENVDIFSAYICNIFKVNIRREKFPSILKNADITAVFKKHFKGSKEN